MADAILAVRDLRVRFRTNDGMVEAVSGIDLDINPGEFVAIVGESGSGKSQSVMAAMGLLASNGEATGSVRYRGTELLGLKPAALNAYRGRKLAMIFQEPMTSLDPLFRIGTQIAAPLRRHQGLSRQAARARALELLKLVQIPRPEARLDAYPHELSGGQRQRVMIAMALANDPDILIADEPTTALDVTIEADILNLIADLRQRLGMAVILISHDLGLVRRYAERVYVMKDGEVVESGPAETLFAAPAHPYTQQLVAAEPEGRKPPVPPYAPVLLDAKNIRVSFDLSRGIFRREHFVLHAVDGVDLTLRRGQTIGIVGESGSGKSTLGRALLKLMPSTGTIRFEDRALEPLDRAAMRPLRRSLQAVFQDPYGSLSPRMTVGEIVGEGLLVHAPQLNRAERDRRAAEALAEVSLDPALRNRYPHEFSGGQRQRIAIARAMILNPALVVLDEPTSALDRTVQKSIVALLKDMQTRHALSYLFISHDLAVVRAMADTLMVMKDGRVIEGGPTEAIFEAPREAYTRRLLAASIKEVREPSPVRRGLGEV
ncbi:ABC transporter ATP-binding protein [Bosea caraganae]|uniref:ABC transporter ATP-binding protein n=1 Tax=Bosea caraganae TaxID=2763117 RepID=A0A370L426_9HYPH|nr:ABC transporter ATP-binding protein [Bosea caraganae]RDJ23039.1 ABC transporter ATP-binding protein [Bosea caraganae]RDJ28819.1 ABC transporter ATP-binding protein [Bosea caraganae]